MNEIQQCFIEPHGRMCIAASWSENSDFGQNSDQNHGKCSFGQKKVRILDSSQKF